MRITAATRWACAALLAAAPVLLGAGPAGASPVVVKATAKTVCTVTDHRLIGLSGLVVTPTGYVSIADSNPDKSAIRIWYLDKHCKPLRSVSYPTSAYDPEDAAESRDGTLYVADIGDNGRTRSSIAVWRLAPGAKTPKIYRYRYPDGAHDAEAILLAADDTPIFVTKDPLVAGLYVPTGTADPSGTPVPLRKVGTFALTPTDTPSGVGVLGGFVVTGGANSPDRTRVALRSYNDAYEWAVPDGDVVKAITTTAPVITPLPNEPQGESIAYGPDGRHFSTISDQETQPVRTPILEYPSALHTAPSAAPSAAATGRSIRGAAAPARSESRGPWLAAGAAVVVVVGVVLTVAVRLRRR